MTISIIILTYNRINDTLALLHNLKTQTFPDFEIIVIDNNSTDSTQKEIQHKFPEVRYIKIFYNSGVPGGRNFGIANAKGKYLVFIDNDAEIENDFVEKVAQTFNNYADAGILSFKILNYYTKKLDMTSWVINRDLLLKEQSCPVHSFIGAGFAIRKQVINILGLFWEKLFFMHEEKEYSMRLLSTKYKVYYTPNIEVNHKISPENRFQLSERFYFYGIRNEFWIYIRNVPLGLLINYLSKFIISNFFYAAKRGYLLYYLKGIYQGIFYCGDAIKKRKPISKESIKYYNTLVNLKKDSLITRLKRFLTTN